MKIKRVIDSDILYDVFDCTIEEAIMNLQDIKNKHKGKQLWLKPQQDCAGYVDRDRDRLQLSYEEEETKEESLKREKAEAEVKKQQEEYERQHYELLKKKFGSGNTTC